MQMKDETESNREHETETHNRDPRRKKISETIWGKERALIFFQRPILFHLNPRILATPRAHRTSDQTERALEHTAPIVLSPPCEIPPLPLWNEKWTPIDFRKSKNFLLLRSRAECVQWSFLCDVLQRFCLSINQEQHYHLIRSPSVQWYVWAAAHALNNPPGALLYSICLLAAL